MGPSRVEQKLGRGKVGSFAWGTIQTIQTIKHNEQFFAQLAIVTGPQPADVPGWCGDHPRAPTAASVYCHARVLRVKRNLAWLVFALHDGWPFHITMLGGSAGARKTVAAYHPATGATSLYQRCVVAATQYGEQHRCTKSALLLPRGGDTSMAVGWGAVLLAARLPCCAMPCRANEFLNKRLHTAFLCHWIQLGLHILMRII